MLNFKKEVEAIKNDLQLGEEIQVLTGKQAEELINKNEKIYKEKYNISLTDVYNGGYGFYLWWENENTVLVKDNMDFINLAHELRHAWQHVHHREKGFKFKRPSGSKLLYSLYTIFIYPITKTELDANIYAYKYAKQKGLSTKRQLQAIGLNYLMKLIPILILIIAFGYVFVR